MISIALLATVFTGSANAELSAKPEQEFLQASFKSAIDTEERIMMVVKNDQLNPPKRSPMDTNWAFSYTVAGLGRPPRAQQFSQRIRVFAQTREKIDDNAYHVARMIMRLWDYNAQKLSLEHAERFGRTVDVYLCNEGKPGAEQRLLWDKELPDASGRASQVNTIHVFDFDQLNDPMERAREVAHEYGHATLPAIGGYSAPESWANGDLGERLYLKWLYTDMMRDTLGWLDTTGAKKEQIAEYLKKNYDPLVSKMALNGPDINVLGKKDKAAFFEYVALSLYANEILPLSAFRRSLLLTGNGHGAQMNKGVIDAAAEISDLAIKIPPQIGTSDLWVPLGKGRLTTGRLVSRRGDWAKVKPANGVVIIKNPPIAN